MTSLRNSWAGGSTAQMFQAMLLGPWRSRKSSQQMGNVLVKPNQRDLIFMKELIEAGKVTPVIDRRFTLRDVADAIGYVEDGHAKGKVVITVDQNDNTSL
jgi:NADPH:quinone reductase-like Zn-dependent oxidoreductase